MTAAPPATPNHRWVIVLCAIGGMLRLTGLDVHSLWFDEAATVHCALAGDLVGVLRADRHPPLSFLSFGAWIAWFGQADATLRRLPALLSCISLLAFARCSVRMVSGDAARAAAVALYALSPFLIWHGQEVRMYAFVEFGAVVALLAATAWLDAGARPSRVSGVMLGVVIATGCHYLGALAAVAVCAVALVSPGSRRRRALVGVVACAGVLVWLPWFVTLIPEQLRAPWSGATTRAGLVDLAELPARMFVYELWRLPRAVQIVVVLPASVVFVAIALQVARVVASTATSNERRALAAMISVLAAAFGVGMFWKLDFLPRYLIAAAPPSIAVVAAGIVAIPAGWLRRTLVAVLIGGAVMLSVLHRRANLREDYRSACAEVADAWRPGDSVLMITGTPADFSEAGLRHYLRDRPSILASIVGEEVALRQPAALVADGHRLHVVYRSAPYAEGRLHRVEAALARDIAAEDRFRIRYMRFVAPR